MKFDQVATSIGKVARAAALKKFQGLTLELGVREDNEHVGSGLGGNNAQLFGLMSLRHELVSDPNLTIDYDNHRVRWGYEWLDSSKRKAQRYELDAKLPVPRTATFDDVRNDPRFAYGPNIANLDLLLFASKLCQDLATDLDNGIENKITPTAMALSGFPQEIILVAVRRYIQIERLVRHNLDEHKEFGRILHTISKEMDN